MNIQKSEKSEQMHIHNYFGRPTKKKVSIKVETSKNEEITQKSVMCVAWRYP